MEGTDRAFFYSARAYGVNQVVLWIADKPFLDSWASRFAYFSAKSEERNLYLYGMDLVWLGLKGRYDIPQPSAYANKKVIRDTRSAREIMKDTIKKLLGE